jgi:NTP pyrophosphatase (non-canonical NTP hydrolase)
MNVNEYQQQALRTANITDPLMTKLMVCGLGVSGEAGEITDYIKKVLFHGHSLDPIKLAKEIGDCLWYLSYLSDSIHINLETIMQMNIDKLKARYPDGFDPILSQNRKEGDI